MGKKVSLCFVYSCLILLAISQVGITQDRFIDCRKLDTSISLTIDGKSDDWPLAGFGEPALLGSDFDITQTGDHFILDRATANYDNQDNTNSDTGVDDFDTTTYITWNDEAFFVLNIAKDDMIGFEHANDGSIDEEGYFVGGSDGWTNDGIEFWMDLDNNREPANIDEDQTSPFDFQLNFLIDDALQARDYPDIPEEDRVFRWDNFYYHSKEFFRWGSELNDGGDLEFELLSKIDAITVIDDDNMGYTQEIRIPFGEFEMFEPTHPIGISISWMDWDEGEFSHWVWHGTVDAQTADYKELRFSSDRPLGTTPIYPWSLYEQ